MLRAFPLRGHAAELGPDDALVLAAQADGAEFAVIYERYFPRVYRYLAARAASPEEAADLAQSVFLKAFGALDRYRPGSAPFSSWLFRIARNTAIDAHRRRKPGAAWELIEGQPSATAGPEFEALHAERIRELRLAISMLDSQKRDLLALRYAGGLTAAEIAPLAGKSPEAVKKQLQRTLQQLKEHFRDYD